MMKPKGPLDASTYTKWLRQKANVGMFNNDVNKAIPQYERKSIISKAPAADLPARGLFTQLQDIVATNAIIPLITLTDLGWNGADLLIFDNVDVTPPSRTIDFKLEFNSGLEGQLSALSTPLTALYKIIQAEIIDKTQLTLTGDYIIDINPYVSGDIIRVTFQNVISTFTTVSISSTL